MVRSEWDVSFIAYTTLVAGIAMPTTIRIGTTVHRVSKNLFPVKVAAACPTDLRWRAIDQIMIEKTIAMIAMMTTRSSELRSLIRCAISVTGAWNQKRFM